MLDYERPRWQFNKLLYCEKEGLFPILQHARWPERHDCALLTSKGYATRAAREALKLVGSTDEPIKFFCIHDADGDGTMIFQTLRDALKGQNVTVINLGLDPSEAQKMGLNPEEVNRKGERKTRVADYLTRDEKAWLQDYRIELNAMATKAFVTWLTTKIAQHDTGKLIPPAAVVLDKIRVAAHSEATRLATEAAVLKAKVSSRVAVFIGARADDFEHAAAELTSNLPALLGQNPDQHWSNLAEQEGAKIATAIAG
jgi:hypothetical protein